MARGDLLAENIYAILCPIRSASVVFLVPIWLRRTRLYTHATILGDVRPCLRCHSRPLILTRRELEVTRSDRDLIARVSITINACWVLGLRVSGELTRGKPHWSVG